MSLLFRKAGDQLGSARRVFNVAQQKYVGAFHLRCFVDDIQVFGRQHADVTGCFIRVHRIR